MSKALFIGGEIFTRSGFSAGHPLAIPRLGLTMALCRALGWLDETNYAQAPLASVAQLSRFHDPAYLAALQRGAAGTLLEADKDRFNLGRQGNPLFAEMFVRPATACGGGLRAVELLSAQRPVIFNPAGGTHHGRRDRASGFCFLNEPVLSILALLDKGTAPIFYLDLDAHHGDGVQDAFAADPRVFCLSLHEAGRWPMQAGGSGSVTDRGGGFARNLPVPAGFNDSELAFLIEAAVLPLIERQKPAVLVVQCGVDALADDPMTSLCLSNGALWSAVTSVQQMAPLVLLLGGGGYNPFAVARAWSGLWALISGQPLPESLPPAAETLLRQIEWRHRMAREAPTRWFTTLVDPPRWGPIRDEVRCLPTEVLRE